MRELFLFPDTNLFVQCKPLEELDWSTWGDFDEINLLVTRPVQAEIDNQKGKGSGRLAKRARAISSRFRELLLSGKKQFEIRSEKPLVRLALRQEIKWDPTLSDRLSYTERDDQLVGCAHQFATENPSFDVRLLTHDTGPMTSADMVGLGFEAIPDVWLLAPEPDETEKRLNATLAELARLKKTEPEFEISIDGQEKSHATLNFEVQYHSALLPEQITELTALITTHCPKAEDFGPVMPEERDVTLPFGFRFGTETFTPASPEEIQNYEKQYSDWIIECKRQLEDLHTSLNRDLVWPRVLVICKNAGSRPAEHALISFEADGAFAIMPFEAPRQSDTEGPKPLIFAVPPSPPKGSWRSSIQAAQGLLDMMSANTFPLENRIGDFNSIHSFSRDRHDPNAFYYRPSKPKLPTDSYSLECTQWRHQGEDEHFETTLHVPLDPNNVQGALRIRIEAANLTTPLSQHYPVRVTVKAVSVYDAAKRIVDLLINR